MEDDMSTATIDGIPEEIWRSIVAQFLPAMELNKSSLLSKKFRIAFQPQITKIYNELTELSKKYGKKAMNNKYPWGRHMKRIESEKELIDMIYKKQITNKELNNILKIIDYPSISGYDFNKNDMLLQASRSRIKGYKNIVKILLDADTDVNTTDVHGNTALIWSSKNDNIDIMKILLDAGADVNAKDVYSNTALIWASFKGNTEIVKILLDVENINVNDTDDDDRTALMNASRNNNIDAVELLLDVDGIDVNYKNKYGDTALILARVYKHNNVEKILLKHMAKS